MKTKILSLFASAALMLGLTGCDQDWTPKVVSTGDVDLSSVGVEVKSRSEHDLGAYIVKIFNTDTEGDPAAQWTMSEMPEIFTLPVGSYRLDILSHEIQPAEWEKPHYLGSADFVIKANEITAIGKVTCKFASLGVKVTFSDQLLAVCGSDVKVDVMAGEQGTLSFTPAESRTAYFALPEGSRTLAAHFEGTVNGNLERLHKVYDNVATGEVRSITFTLKGETIDPIVETGYVDTTDGVSISMTMTREDVEGGINNEEEPTDNPTRPGQENFTEAIEVSGPLAEGGDVRLPLASADDASLTIGVGNGIEALTLAMASDNAAASAVTSAVDGLDLATAATAPYGLPTAVAGLKSVQLALAQLATALQDYEGTHRLTITVTDSAAKAKASRADADNVKVIEIVFTVGGAEPITFDTDLSFTAPNRVDVEKAVVVIAAEAGLAHLVVDIASDNDAFKASAGEMLPLHFDLATITGTDAENIASLGLPVGSEVVGKTSVDFNISDLVPLLAAFQGTHKFTITVEDAAGHKATRTLTFVAE